MQALPAGAVGPMFSSFAQRIVKATESQPQVSGWLDLPNCVQPVNQAGHILDFIPVQSSAYFLESPHLIHLSDSQ